MSEARLSSPGSLRDPMGLGSSESKAKAAQEQSVPPDSSPSGRRSKPPPPKRLRIGDTRVPERDETLTDEEQRGARQYDGMEQLPIINPKSYRITGEVGQGGIGRVLRARDQRLGRPVAIKELSSSAGLLAEERFVREALLTARLQHPSIVPLYEAGRWPDGSPFYAMKCFSGRSLADMILDSRTLDQRLELLPHVLAVAEAMAYAHSERIIHRDLKPANILVGAFGETVVIDWGLAKDLAEDQHDPSAPPADTTAEPPAADAAWSRSAPHRDQAPRPPLEGLTMHGAVMGTPTYMPPEQAIGKQVDERADVYALGAILYHLLAGLCPYDGDSSVGILRKVIARAPEPLEQRQKGIPEDLLTIVKKAMAREPADRYPSAKELAEDLRRFQTGQIVGAHKYSRAERVRRFVHRHRGGVAVGAMAIGMVAITVGLGFHHNLTQRTLAEEGEARARSAQQEAIERADELTLVQARAAVLSDPNEALAWLKSLSPSFSRWPEARLIAADAQAHGIATVLRGHTGSIGEVVFSPDGKLLVTSSDDRAVQLWDVATGKSRSIFTGHTDEVWHCSFSPSGRLLASAGKDKTIRIWDTQTSERLQLLTGHTEPVTTVIFSGEDAVVSGSYDRTVRIWDLRTGDGRILDDNASHKNPVMSADGALMAIARLDGQLSLYDREPVQIRSFAGSESPALEAVITPDNSAVLARSADGSLRRWDLASGEAQLLAAPLPDPAGFFPLAHGFKLSPDGKQLAGISVGPGVHLWDMASGQEQILADHQGAAVSVAFSPDSQLLASGSYDHSVHLWDVAHGHNRQLRGFKDKVGPVAFSPDGKLLAAASDDRTVRLFPLTTTSSRILLDHAPALQSVAFSPDGARIAAAGKDGQVRLVDVASGALTLFSGHTGPVNDAVFSPDGQLIASISMDQSARIWDLDGHEIWALESTTDAAANVAFSPDGRRFAAPGRDSTVALLDVDSGTRWTLSGHTGDVKTLAFSPDGWFLASGSADRTVRIWDLEDGWSQVLSRHDGEVSALAFSPDSRTLASSGVDHTLRLWDLVTGERRRIDAGGWRILRLAFTADSAMLISNDTFETNVRRWNLVSLAPEEPLRGHGGTVANFSLSPDERRLATAGADGTVRLWDLASGESRLLSGHAGAVNGVAFAPDRKLIASAGEDGTIRLWTDDVPEDGTALRAWIHAATPDTIGSYHHLSQLLAKRAPSH